MAEAKKCDRCGRLYEIKESNVFLDLAENVTRLLVYDSVRDACDKFDSNFDVCDECFHSFKTWWKEEKNNG